MKNENYCINCMQKKKKSEAICPFCGFDECKYERPFFALAPETILNGKYMVGIVLGQGGFGIVYLAWDLGLERRVAIKEFFVAECMQRISQPENALESAKMLISQEKVFESNRKRFEEEAKILASLENLPGIVHTYDYFEENNTCYIVMEYLEGQTLRQTVMGAHGSYEPLQMLGALQPMLQSLVKIQAKQILHRDISPDNIMIDSNGEMTLFDFGNAKYQSEKDEENTLIVKAGYSPIEQLQLSEQQGMSVDVYAMASTIYFGICGKDPVDSPSRAIEPKTFQTLQELKIPISSKQQEVLQKGMAIRKGERYATMQEFVMALNHVWKQQEEHFSIPKKMFFFMAGVGVMLFCSGAAAQFFSQSLKYKIQQEEESETVSETEIKMSRDWLLYDWKETEQNGDVIVLAEENKEDRS